MPLTRDTNTECRLGLADKFRNDISYPDVVVILCSREITSTPLMFTCAGRGVGRQKGEEGEGEEVTGLMYEETPPRLGDNLESN